MKVLNQFNPRLTLQFEDQTKIRVVLWHREFKDVNGFKITSNIAILGHITKTNIEMVRDLLDDNQRIIIAVKLLLKRT